MTSNCCRMPLKKKAVVFSDIIKDNDILGKE